MKKSNSSELVRSAVLQEYLKVAKRIGFSPEEMLKRANIREEDLSDPENMVAASAVRKIIEDSAVCSGCETLGLHMAECRTYASLGPLSLLLQYESTVRVIVETMIRYQRLLGDVCRLYLEDHGDLAVISVDLIPGFASRQTVETAVAMVFRAMKEIMGTHWDAERIHFRHSAPSNLVMHKSVFGVPVEFESEFDGIVCASESLNAANPKADPTMAQHAHRFISMLSPQQTEISYSAQARHSISLLLNSGNATMERVADQLGLHPRSLQRFLSREGESFGTLLNDTRKDLAYRYLTGSSLSVTDIAHFLGYSTVSSFTRWFTEEFGKSPAAWRKIGLEEAAAYCLDCRTKSGDCRPH